MKPIRILNKLNESDSGEVNNETFTEDLSKALSKYGIHCRLRHADEGSGRMDCLSSVAILGNNDKQLATIPCNSIPQATNYIIEMDDVLVDEIIEHIYDIKILSSERCPSKYRSKWNGIRRILKDIANKYKRL